MVRRFSICLLPPSSFCSGFISVAVHSNSAASAALGVCPLSRCSCGAGHREGGGARGSTRLTATRQHRRGGRVRQPLQDCARMQTRGVTSKFSVHLQPVEHSASRHESLSYCKAVCPCVRSVTGCQEVSACVQACPPARPCSYGLAGMQPLEGDAQGAYHSGLRVAPDGSGGC